MTEEEFKKFVVENKKKMDKSFKEIEKHSKAFDKKVSEILAAL